VNKLHPHLNPLPSRERILILNDYISLNMKTAKFPCPMRKKVRVRGNE